MGILYWKSVGTFRWRSVPTFIWEDDSSGLYMYMAFSQLCPKVDFSQLFPSIEFTNP
jgi:hypothetical protein